MNTSTESGSTTYTMVTVTDGGETEDGSINRTEDRVRITPNLLENALNESSEKEEEFFSAASSNEEGTTSSSKRSSEDLKSVFPNEGIATEEYDDPVKPLLRHIAIPKARQGQEINPKDEKEERDMTLEWYNIKMKQQRIEQQSTQRRNLQTTKRLRLLSKKYGRCHFEEQRVRDDLGRNSSGFAAEQVTIDSEDSFHWESASLTSPPIPVSPTGSLTPDTEQPKTVVTAGSLKGKEHFKFPPTSDSGEELRKGKTRRESHQTEGIEMKHEKELATITEISSKKLKADSSGRRLSMTSVIRAKSEEGKPRSEKKGTVVGWKGEGATEGTSQTSVATIVVQQPSVTGNSPEHQNQQQQQREEYSMLSASSTDVRSLCSSDESFKSERTVVRFSPGSRGVAMKHMLDVTNTTALLTLNHWNDEDYRCDRSHHNRSQSMRAPSTKSKIQKKGANGNGSTQVQNKPTYLCLPQQRSRVASMPNTGADVEEEYYRLRQFSIIGKGIINRGDSLKSRRSRSNTSVASSNSSHSTEHITTAGTTYAVVTGGCSSHAGTASGVPSLPSSRESSCASCPGINSPFRVVMLGSCGVGKSSLVSQFMTSEYLQASGISIDEDFGEKSVCVSLDGEESEIVFIDQPSSKISPEENLSNYESPHGYCVVYSTTDRVSFIHAELFLQALWKADSIRSKAVILVGNKTDLVRSRAVTTEEGTKMATSYDCKFIETSVGINHNVDELLVGILTQIRLKLENPADPTTPRDQVHFTKRSKSPLSNCAPRLYRGSKTSASLRVRKILSKVWSINSKSKSCENLHVL